MRTRSGKVFSRPLIPPPLPSNPVPPSDQPPTSSLSSTLAPQVTSGAESASPPTTPVHQSLQINVPPSSLSLNSNLTEISSAFIRPSPFPMVTLTEIVDSSPPSSDPANPAPNNTDHHDPEPDSSPPFPPGFPPILCLHPPVFASRKRPASLLSDTPHQSSSRNPLVSGSHGSLQRCVRACFRPLPSSSPQPTYCAASAQPPSSPDVRMRDACPIQRSFSCFFNRPTVISLEPGLLGPWPASPQLQGCTRVHPRGRLTPAFNAARFPMRRFASSLNRQASPTLPRSHHPPSNRRHSPPFRFNSSDFPPLRRTPPVPSPS